MLCNLPWDAINDGEMDWDDPEVQAHITHLDNCEWYEDEEGFLYIVDEEIDDLIHGPDNEMAERMYAALQSGVYAHRLEDRIEGLTYISWMLHRFNTEDGFYHA